MYREDTCSCMYYGRMCIVIHCITIHPSCIHHAYSRCLPYTCTYIVLQYTFVHHAYIMHTAGVFPVMLHNFLSHWLSSPSQFTVSYHDRRFLHLLFHFCTFITQRNVHHTFTSSMLSFPIQTLERARE